MTLDNASSNTCFVALLISQLNIRNALICNGEYIHMRCCCHIINLIVQDGLKVIDESVNKIIECIKYIRGSQARKIKFHACVKVMDIEGKKGLKQDVPTRWNSTFLCLTVLCITVKHFVIWSLVTQTSHLVLLRVSGSE